MSNYLANISARTINTAPTVRPRLRGRFDPIASPGDGALEQPVVNRSVARTPLNEIGAATRYEQDGAFGGSVNHSIDRLTPGRSSSSEQPEDEGTDRGRTALHTAATRSLPVPILHATIEAAPPTHSLSNRAYANARPSEPGITDDTNLQASPSVEVPAVIPRPANERQAVSANSRPIELGQNVQPQPRMRIEPPSRLDPGALIRPSIFEGVIEREVRTAAVHDDSQRVNSRADSPVDTHAPKMPDSPDQRVLATTEETTIASEPRRVAIVIQPRVEPVKAFSDRLSMDQSEQQNAPAVHVTIGRIEVRAVQQPLQTTVKSRPAQPVMNLDDYLRRRSNGSAR